MKWLTNIFSKEDVDRAWSAGEKGTDQDDQRDAADQEQPAPEPPPSEPDNGIDQ